MNALLKSNALLRKHTAGLYETLLKGQHWQCQADDHNHLLNLRLEPLHERHVSSHSEQSINLSTIAFLLHKRSPQKTSSPLSLAWQESIVEVETIGYQEDFPCCERSSKGEVKPPLSEKSKAILNVAGLPSRSKKSVGFVGLEADNGHRSFKSCPGTLQDRKVIENFCAALMASKIDGTDRDYLGCLTSEQATNRHCNIYVVRSLNQSVHARPLRQILMIARDQKLVFQVPLITKRDCLLLAVILASNIVRLNGNWLRPDWTLEDIVFSEVASNAQNRTKQNTVDKYMTEAPYLSCQVPSHDRNTLELSSVHSPMISSMIKCPTLFPLGIALVELALWKPLSQIPSQDEDSDLNPAVASLKKATRLLPVVSEELGPRYKDVVEECLWWPSSRAHDNHVENEDFQRAVYQNIVLPLAKELNAFDGK